MNMELEKKEIIKNVHERLENVAALTPFERVLIDYVAEEVLKMVKK